MPHQGLVVERLACNLLHCYVAAPRSEQVAVIGLGDANAEWKSTIYVRTLLQFDQRGRLAKRYKRPQIDERINQSIE
jgi:hypothetical protein